MPFSHLPAPLARSFALLASALDVRTALRLPVLLSPARRPQAGGGSDGVACACSSKCRVLVVDDNEDSATSLALMLQIMGYDTRTAHDGLEAVGAAVGEEQLGVLLRDVHHHRLRGLPGNQEGPALLIDQVAAGGARLQRIDRTCG